MVVIATVNCLKVYPLYIIRLSICMHWSVVSNYNARHSTETTMKNGKGREDSLIGS